MKRNFSEIRTLHFGFPDLLSHPVLGGLLISLILLQIPRAESAQKIIDPKKCEPPLLSEHIHLADDTDKAIAYMGSLYDRRIIGNAELARFFEVIKRGQIANPISEDDALTSPTLFIHREGLERRLNNGKIDLERTREWTELTLKNGAAAQVNRESARSESQATYSKIEFHPVPGRKFKIGKNQQSATLTHEIEVMSTPMTQKQWVEIFDENPSTFKTGEDSVKESGVDLRANSPVETMTWWSAIMAANKLSRINNLPEVYDVSGIQWKPDTHPENGTLKRERGALRINAPEGDIYQAQGYRLPTHAELENLLALEEEQNKDLPITKRAWIKSNSNKITHPVAQLAPLLINDKPIFDLVGNVLQWTHDWSDSTNMLAPEDNFKGTDPLKFSPDHRMANRDIGSYTLKGASFRSEAKEIGPSEFRTIPTEQTFPVFGVRFVRTIR